MKSKIESFRNKDYFNNDDIQRSFGFARPNSANAFLNVLLNNGVIMKASGGTKKSNITVGDNDDWTFELDPTSDLHKNIDIESELNKIKTDKKYRGIEFSITKKNANSYWDRYEWIRTTKFKFLKPFLEGGYYKNIPSDSPVDLGSSDISYWSRPSVKVLDLFPSYEDFYKFLEANPEVLGSDMRKLPSIDNIEDITINMRLSA
jgi:hypothetical protein